jgi:DNA-directed RNA polymerase specialized sigma24 family protein
MEVIWIKNKNYDLIFEDLRPIWVSWLLSHHVNFDLFDDGLQEAKLKVFILVKTKVVDTTKNYRSFLATAGLNAIKNYIIKQNKANRDSKEDFDKVLEEQDESDGENSQI